MEKNELERLFEARLQGNEWYQKALEIVKKNSAGRIWLIGGALSRELASILHGGTVNEYDFDFVVENANDKVVLPKDWRIVTNKFGNPKFIHGELSIDFVPLKNVRSILQRKLQPTIENLLSGTPFNAQAIAYDTKAGKIIGDIGLKAIYEKRFGINNLEQARYLAGLKKMPLRELLVIKAKSMGFTPLLNGLE